MKKKVIIISLIVLTVLILIIPMPIGQLKDGGTKEYRALTYRVVKWHRVYGENHEIYDETKIYFFPKNFLSLEELFEMEING